MPDFPPVFSLTDILCAAHTLSPKSLSLAGFHVTSLSVSCLAPPGIAPTLAYGSNMDENHGVPMDGLKLFLTENVLHKKADATSKVSNG